jgi:hypothetical protein
MFACLKCPTNRFSGNLYAFLGTADKYLTIHTASGGEAYDAVRELYRASIVFWYYWKRAPILIGFITKNLLRF